MGAIGRGVVNCFWTVARYPRANNRSTGMQYSRIEKSHFHRCLIYQPNKHMDDYSPGIVSLSATSALISVLSVVLWHW